MTVDTGPGVGTCSVDAGLEDDADPVGSPENSYCNYYILAHQFTSFDTRRSPSLAPRMHCLESSETNIFKVLLTVSATSFIC